MNLFVVGVVFTAMFVQSLAGFGASLIAMPFLLAILGPEVARPMFILLGQTAGLLYMFKYREDWQFPDIKTLLIGTVIGIPVGSWAASNMAEDTFMIVLGCITIGYACYALSGARLPEMHPNWSAFFGFLSGILHSAYNVGGPPLVMYNSTHDWEARRFKGNMQAIFFVMSFFVIFAHFQAGNYTSTVLIDYLILVPVMVVALYTGFALEKYISQQAFRKGVMVLLIFVGLSLIF